MASQESTHERPEFPEKLGSRIPLLSPSWIRPILRLAKTKDLSLDDIYLVPRDSRIEPIFAKYKSFLNDGGHESGGVFTGLAKFYSRRIIITMILSVMSMALYLMFAISLRSLLLAESPTRRLICALTASSLLSAGELVQVAWTRYLSIHLTEFRALLELTVCEKVLRIRTKKADVCPDSQIMVLAVNDIPKITEACMFFVIFASILLVILPYVAFMGDSIKSAAFPFWIISAILLLLFVGFTVFVLQKRKPAIRASDYRVGLLGEALKSIQIVKFHGWERPLADAIDNYRKLELKNLKLVRLFMSLLDAVKTRLPTFGICLTFLWYLHTHCRRLTPADAYPFMLSGVLSFQGLSMIPGVLVDLARTVTAVGRLNTLFELEEWSPVLQSLPKDGPLAFKKVGPLPQPGSRCHVPYQDDLTNIDENNRDPRPAIPESPRNERQDDPVPDLTIRKGSLVIVTGSAGSGKTAFLGSLQGSDRFKPFIASANMKTSSVLSHWTFQGTIRENILFGSKWDMIKYEEVVEKCRLSVDLSTLPDGDQTVLIGEGASILSGGQLARLALARCLYTDVDVFILDDVLSAVDGFVASQIFSYLRNLCQNTRSSKTVILASNDLKLLTQADLIVYLKGHGKYIYGSFDSLLRDDEFQETYMSGTSAPDLYQDAIDSDGAREDSGSDEDCEASQEEEANFVAYGGNSTSFQQSEHERVVGQDDHQTTLDGSNDSGLDRSRWAEPTISQGSSTDYDVAQCTLDKGKTPHSKPTHQSTASMSNFYGLAKFAPFGTKCLFCIAIMLDAIPTALSTKSMMILMRALRKDSVSEQMVLIREMCVLLSMAALIATVPSMIWDIAGDSLMKSVDQTIVDRLFHAPMSFYESVPFGSLLRRLTGDWRGTERFVRDILKKVTAITAAALIALAPYLYFAPSQAVVLLTIQGVIFFMSILPGKDAEQIHSFQMACSSKVIARMSELIHGSKVFVDLGKPQWALDQIAAEINDRTITSLLSTDITTASYYKLLFLSAPLSLIAFGMITTIYQIDAAGMAMLTIQFAMLQNSLRMAAPLLDSLAREGHSVQRLLQLSLAPQEPYERSADGNGPLLRWTPTNGKVEFRDVSFRYQENLPFVLRNFNMVVNGGEKVGVCGRTGSGKSTLINTIFRISNLSAGHIYIDDADIFSDLSLDEVRNSFVIIPQKNVLFRGTIRSNLDPQGDRTDHELWDALRRSGLLDLRKRVRFLDELVEEDGKNFSLGECQLIALARALILKKRIVLLDEATAAVDDAADMFVQETIKREFADCTVISVAHRIQTIVKFDKVLAMAPDLGKMEFGTPKELYDRRGLFWDMCEDAGIGELDF